ncbi:MAG: hypothetical protein FWG87_05950 [Defluviitaleaceae bacterium]|nr:hypothetical protein [Defluviitaleaceae bacterium]
MQGTDLSVPRLPRPALLDVTRPQIDERTYLGTDKSVPYKNHANTDLRRFRGFFRAWRISADFPTSQSAKSVKIR